MSLEISFRYVFLQFSNIYFVFSKDLVQDESLPTSYNVTINGNETIYCPVRGYPPPSVTWKKDGILLPEFKTTKLTITFVKEEDLGIYTCLATDGKTALGPLSINVAKESGMYTVMKITT